MSVTSTTNRKSYAGDAVTTSFATNPVVFFDSSDLAVSVVSAAGVETALTENTHYTVTGGNGSTGTVNLAGGSAPYGAPAVGVTLLILRQLPLTQPVDLVQNDGSDAEVQERAYDRLTMMVQQLNEVDARAIKLPPVETGSTALTELPFDRASKFLAFDASKNLIASSGTVDSAVPVSAFMETVLDDATAADARTTLGAADASTVALKGANSDITALTALTSGTPFRKNAIINGDFQVWQEGTSFAAMANGQYVADNWQYQKVGAMVHTGSRSTDVPTIVQAGRKIPYSILIDCTTVDAAIAAGDLTQLITFVEGYNFVNIAGVGLCHQFWHKHTKVGTYCAAYRNAGVDRSFVREYTQAVSDTWELATVLVEASPPAGTWDYTNGIGMYVSFTLAAGTTYQTLAGAWQTGNFFATANQVNACDSVANNFMLAGVQLEKGSVATEFDVRTFADELALCQRYYEKTFDYSVAPVNASGSYVGALISVVPINDTLMYFTFDFKAEKRTNPTIVTYNPTQANNLARTWADTWDSVGITGNGAAGLGRFGFYSDSGEAQNPYAIHATANARF